MLKQKCLQFLLIYLVWNFCESRNGEVDDYIKLILTYYRGRNVKILTHFTCFPQSK